MDKGKFRLVDSFRGIFFLGVDVDFLGLLEEVGRVVGKIRVVVYE